jgi:hypothetical protein
MRNQNIGYETLPKGLTEMAAVCTTKKLYWPLTSTNFEVI